MSAIAKAWVEFGVNQSQLSAGLRKAEGTTKGFVGRMGSMLGGFGAAAAAAAGAGVLYGIKRAVDAYKEQELAVRKLEAVLRSTGNAAGLTSEEIQAFAAQRQAVTNFGDEVTIAGAAILATFKEVRGSAFTDTMAVAQDMSTVLGGDLKGTLLQVGKAMNDPILGATALSRAGVQFTAVQKENIKGFVATNQLAKAQAIVLKELQSQFGGAAEAVADPVKQFKNQVGDLAENIGSVFAPSIDLAATYLGKMLGGVNDNADAFRVFGENVALTFDNLPLSVERAGIEMELALMDAIPGMEGIFEHFGAVTIVLFDGISAAWTSIMEFMSAAADVFVQGFLAAWQRVVNAAERGKELLTGGGTDESKSRRQAAQTAVDARLDQATSTLMKGNNPISAAIEAFTNTRRNALDGFADQGGGLGDTLKKRLEAIDDEFASRRAELFGAKKDVKAPGAIGDGEDAAGGASPETRKHAFTGLAEMAKRIQSGLSPAEKIGKQQVDIAKQQTAKLGEAVAALRSIDDHTRMGTVGTFA